MKGIHSRHRGAGLIIALTTLLVRKFIPFSPAHRAERRLPPPYHIRFMSKPYDIDALTTALRALHVRTRQMG